MISSRRSWRAKSACFHCIPRLSRTRSHITAITSMSMAEHSRQSSTMAVVVPRTAASLRLLDVSAMVFLRMAMFQSVRYWLGFAVWDTSCTARRTFTVEKLILSTRRWFDARWKRASSLATGLRACSSATLAKANCSKICVWTNRARTGYMAVPCSSPALLRSSMNLFRSRVGPCPGPGWVRYQRISPRKERKKEVKAILASSSDATFS